MKQIFILFLLCLLNIYSAAQGENNHWLYGKGQHINFNNNPVSHTYNAAITGSQSVTQSDAQGNLLFYTNGCTVWDRNGNPMPDGFNLGNYGNLVLIEFCDFSYSLSNWGKYSADQGIQILPDPGDKDQYYIIHAGQLNNSLANTTDTIYYSLINMRLNGGLGDVVAGMKNKKIVVPEFRIWSSTITFGNCNNYWLLVRGRYTINASIDNSSILAFELNENGFSATPAINTQPLTMNYNTNYGGMKFLHDEPVLFINNEGTSVLADTASLLRATFDRNTGLLSNYESILDYTWFTDFEFSASGQYLYTTNAFLDDFYQYDLSLYPDIPAVQASKVSIYTSTPSLYFWYSTLKLGPDNKIYVLRDTVLCPSPHGICFTVGRIEAPDLQGTASNFQPDVFIFPTDTFGAYNFGQKVLARRPPRDSIRVAGSPVIINMLCAGDTITLESPRSGMEFYKWSDGSTDSQITVQQTGRYWVQSFSDDCKIYIDTIIVNALQSIFGERADTTICQGEILLLDATQPGNNSYLWSNGSTGPQITVNSAGLYTVTITAVNCVITDSIRVQVLDPRFDILQSDTTICQGARLLLQAESNMGSTIRWSNNTTGSETEVNGTGKYLAYTENRCGRQADSLWVAITDCSCKPVSPSAFSPNNDGKNDIFLPRLNHNCQARHYELMIYNRYGQLVFTTNDPNTGWNGSHAGKSADLGVYYYIIKVTDRYGKSLPDLFKGEVTLIR